MSSLDALCFPSDGWIGWPKLCGTSSFGAFLFASMTSFDVALWLMDVFPAASVAGCDCLCPMFWLNGGGESGGGRRYNLSNCIRIIINHKGILTSPRGETETDSVD